MDLIYEIIKAGTSSKDSDTGGEVARKINDNFNKVKEKVSELEQSIKDGSSANISIGTDTIAGIVKSSNTENGIRINIDGTMEVVSLNVNRLVQDKDDYLILDGNI